MDTTLPGIRQNGHRYARHQPASPLTTPVVFSSRPTRAGRCTTYAYDAETGALTSATEALGNVTVTTYDARKRKIAEENALGATPASATASSTELVAITDALGLVTQYEYDSSGHQIATIDPLGRRTEQTNETAHSWLTQPPMRRRCHQLRLRWKRTADGMTDARGATTRTEYDGFGRVVATIDPLGQRQTTAYDALRSADPARPTRSARPPEPSMTACGRTVIMTGTLGLPTRYQYDDAGRQVAVTDPRGFTSCPV